MMLIRRGDPCGHPAGTGRARAAEGVGPYRKSWFITAGAGASTARLEQDIRKISPANPYICTDWPGMFLFAFYSCLRKNSQTAARTAGRSILKEWPLSKQRFSSRSPPAAPVSSVSGRITAAFPARRAARRWWTSWCRSAPPCGSHPRAPTGRRPRPSSAARSARRRG